MTVDLSSIGLDGQQAYATRMASFAQSRVNNASATNAELENRESARIEKLNELAANALQGGKVNLEDPDAAADRMTSLAEPLEMVGNVYMKGGAIAKGTELMSKASEIRKRESDIKNDGFKAQETRLKNIISGGEIVGKWLGGSRNNDEWNVGMQQIESALQRGDFVMDPEMFAKLKGMPFDPDAAAYFGEQAIDAKAKAELELKERTEVRIADNATISQSQAATRIRLQEARDLEMKTNRERLTKIAGDKVEILGGVIGTVTQPQRVVIANALRTEVFKNLTGKKAAGDADFQSAIDYIAMNAKAELKDNKGIDWYTAVQRSVLRAKEAGTVTEVEQPGSWPWSDPELSKGKLDLSGATKDKPRAPPVGKTGSVDPTKLKKGVYYQLKDGSVGKWDGTGIVVD